MSKARKMKDDADPVTKTASVRLDGDSIKSMALGDITLTLPDPGPTPDNFADAAFRENAGSLRRLMAPYYRIVVVYPEREYIFGLTRWIKLMDGSKEQGERMGDRKQPIRKGKQAA